MLVVDFETSRFQSIIPLAYNGRLAEWVKHELLHILPLMHERGRHEANFPEG